MQQASFANEAYFIFYGFLRKTAHILVAIS